MRLTHLRVHCRWLWRLMTPRQWPRLPHVAAGATAYACVVTGVWFLPPLLADWRPERVVERAEVPEPGTLAVFVVGIVGVLVGRGRRG